MAVKNMVYDALQYAKQVEKVIASHKEAGDYKSAGSDEYLSLNACVNASLTMSESEVELNVCEAIQTLNQRAEEKGRETGRIENLVQNIKNLMKNMGLTAEQAMSVLDVSESDREAIAPKF